VSTTASINAKGTNDTGITDDMIKSLHDNLGKAIVAVVEIRSESRVENLKGDEKVNLVIQTLEPATSSDAEDYLRQFARSMHRQRQVESPDHQPAIDTLDDVEPTVEEVIAAGQDHVAHTDDELPDPDPETDDPGEDGDPDGPWDEGYPEDADAHPVGASTT
jgi:hypothetical protein